MPLAININAMISCAHQGMYKFPPGQGATVQVGGAPAITALDMAPPAIGCVFATAAGPAPCGAHIPPTMGMSTKVMVKGAPLMMQNAMWMTIPTGAGAPVPMTVKSPGNTKVNVNG